MTEVGWRRTRGNSSTRMEGAENCLVRVRTAPNYLIFLIAIALRILGADRGL